MKRRSFLKTGAVAAFPYHLLASDKKRYATDRVKLGPKQVELSRLAVGTGTGSR